MAGKRKPMLADEALRQRILDLVAGGFGIYEACKAVGIQPSTYRTYVGKNPMFRDEVEAAWEAAAEPVLSMLRQEALAGDVTAAREWLKHTQVTKSQKHKADTDKELADKTHKAAEIRHTHELDPGTLRSIQELRDRVAARLPEGDPYAYDVVETREVPNDPR